MHLQYTIMMNKKALKSLKI